jgi:hypothetical protein
MLTVSGLSSRFLTLDAFFPIRLFLVCKKVFTLIQNDRVSGALSICMVLDSDLIALLFSKISLEIGEDA